MELIANLFLIAGSGAAALYCYVLSVRVKDLSKLDQGIGQAVVGLSSQVDELSAALRRAGDTARKAADDASRQTRRAEDVSRRLELMMASMNDLPCTAQQNDGVSRC